MIGFSKSIDAHVKGLDMVLSTLCQAGVFLPLRTCRLFTDCLQILGYSVKPGALGIDKTRVETIKQLHYPQNVANLRSFFELGTHYQ